MVQLDFPYMTSEDILIVAYGPTHLNSAPVQDKHLTIKNTL